MAATVILTASLLTVPLISNGSTVTVLPSVWLVTFGASSVPEGVAGVVAGVAGVVVVGVTGVVVGVATGVVAVGVVDVSAGVAAGVAVTVSSGLA